MNTVFEGDVFAAQNTTYYSTRDVDLVELHQHTSGCSISIGGTPCSSCSYCNNNVSRMGFDCSNVVAGAIFNNDPDNCVDSPYPAPLIVLDLDEPDPPPTECGTDLEFCEGELWGYQDYVEGLFYSTCDDMCSETDGVVTHTCRAVLDSCPICLPSGTCYSMEDIVTFQNETYFETMQIFQSEDGSTTATLTTSFLDISIGAPCTATFNGVECTSCALCEDFDQAVDCENVMEGATSRFCGQEGDSIVEIFSIDGTTVGCGSLPPVTTNVPVATPVVATGAPAIMGLNETSSPTSILVTESPMATPVNETSTPTSTPQMTTASPMTSLITATGAPTASPVTTTTSAPTGMPVTSTPVSRSTSGGINPPGGRILALVTFLFVFYNLH